MKANLKLSEKSIDKNESRPESNKRQSLVEKLNDVPIIFENNLELQRLGISLQDDESQVYSRGSNAPQDALKHENSKRQPLVFSGSIEEQDLRIRDSELMCFEEDKSVCSSIDTPQIFMKTKSKCKLKSKDSMFSVGASGDQRFVTPS